MSARLAAFCATAALGAALAACTHLPPPTGPVAAEADLTRQILVTLRQDGSRAAALVGNPDTVYLRRRGYGPSSDVDRQLETLADDYELNRVDGWTIASLDIYCEVYSLRPNQDIDTVLERVASDPRVRTAQPMNVFETQSLHYDDPYASMQPAIETLSIDAAHERATGQGVTVAVVDSLIDDRHPEMRGRVRYRRDFVGDRHPAALPEIHGTAIAGIIAATINNEEGIVGVAPDVDLAALRACWTVDQRSGRAQCSSFSLALALETALTLGVDVINLSLAGPDDALLAELIDEAVARGLVVVAALADGAAPEQAFPASHPGVIAAGSSGISLPPRSNLLLAPGSEVLSTTPDGHYAFFSGNSMSAAFVAGVSALLIERRPGIDGREVLRLLAETSTVDSINACQAVARVTATDCPAAGALSATGEALSHTTH